MNDFDVWGFLQYCGTGVRFRPDVMASGLLAIQFGRSPKDKPRFRGRRVDVLGRSIQKRPRESPIAALRRYLETASTEALAGWLSGPSLCFWLNIERSEPHLSGKTRRNDQLFNNAVPPVRHSQLGRYQTPGRAGQANRYRLRSMA